MSFGEAGLKPDIVLAHRTAGPLLVLGFADLDERERGGELFPVVG